MNVTIRWKDCSKSDAVTSHLEMKFSKFEDFIFVMPNMKAEITYYPKNQSYTTSVNVQTKGKGILRAESNAQDILTSINTVTEKMLDQLRRVKTSYEN